MRRTIGYLAVVVGFLMMPARSTAQPSNALTCPRLPSETMTSWMDRCGRQEERAREAEEAARADNEARKRAIGQQLAETDRQRKALEKQPPLPAARNRLLGRWQSSTSKPASSSDPFAGIAAMLTGCGVLIGDGIVSFEPDRWAMYDSDGRNDMGAISYRAGTKGEVYGLPAQGSIFNLLPFEFINQDRIRLIGVVCTLVRVKDAAPVTGRAGAPPASGRATPGTASPVRGAPAPSAAPAAGSRGAAASAPVANSRLERFRGRIGYDCPDGVDVAVDSCSSEPDDAKATCVVVRVDQPPRNGVEVTFTETYAALVKRIASCKRRPLIVLDGKLDFAP